MLPALDPWVQMKMPHLTKEQRGAVIGKMDRGQIDKIVNSQSNAGQALAWHNQHRSPMALERQAEDTYNNAIAGQKHHNARVQARLDPILQRVRDADLDYVDGAVYDEIARILKEEGEAKPGGSKSAQWYENAVTIRDPNTGKAVGYTWTDQQNKTHTYTLPKQEAGKTLTQSDIWEQRHKLNEQIGSRHAQMVSNWESRYASAPAYEGDKPQVPSQDVAQFSQADATGRVRHWRLARADDPPSLQQLQRGNMFYSETHIPPRPTWGDAVSQFPGAAAYLGQGQAGGGPGMPPQRGGVQPTPQPVRQPAPSGGVTRPGQTPGQVTPTPVPRQPGLPVSVTPRTVKEKDFRPEGAIQAKEEASAIAVKKLRGPSISPTDHAMRDSKDPTQRAKYQEKMAAREIGSATNKGLTALIGSEGRKKSPLSVEFELHVRRGGKPEAFAPRIMVDSELRSHRKHIKDFDNKIDKATATPGEIGGFPRYKARVQELVGGPKAGLDTTADRQQLLAHFQRDPTSAHQRMKRAGFTESEIQLFHDTQQMYKRRRVFATSIAAAAVKHTPPGERPDIGNIPILDNDEFEQRAVGLPVYNPVSHAYAPDVPKPGDVFLTQSDGLFVVTKVAIDKARQRGAIRFGSQLQQDQPFGIPRFIPQAAPTQIPSPFMTPTTPPYKPQ